MTSETRTKSIRTRFDQLGKDSGVKMLKGWKTDLDNLVLRVDWNPVKHDEAAIAEMCDLIEQGKVTMATHPILVRSNPDNKTFTVIDGHRRVLAARKCIKPDSKKNKPEPITEWSIVEANTQEHEDLFDAITSREGQRKMTDIELFKAAVRAFEIVPNYETLGTYFKRPDGKNRSESNMKHLVAVGRLNPTLFAYIEDGIIQATDLITMVRKDGEQKTQERIEAYIEKNAQDQVQNETPEVPRMTKNDLGVWQHKFGKTSVQILSEAEVKVNDDKVHLTIPSDKWQEIQKYIETLG